MAYELAGGQATSPVCMMHSGLPALDGAQTRPAGHPATGGDIGRPHAVAAVLHVGSGSTVLAVGVPHDAPVGTVLPRA